MKNYKSSSGILNLNSFRILRLSTILTLSLLIFSCSSCKKDKNDANPNGSNNNSGNNNPTSTAPTITQFKVKVNGVLWEADSTNVSAIYTALAKSLVMSATKSDGSQFTVQINLWELKTGSFNTALTGTSNIVGLTFKDAASESWGAPAKIDNNANNISTGTLKIEYYDGVKVKASFNFTGGSQKTSTTQTISEGEISILKINS